ncbi:SDR family NAD(P)-dependent oxidoreductase [Phyllobacterium myrsinacearum]|uniref:NAD(P)-dependent dehydrogenase (Short-subunit alcohol dehydrogenase family) n=1 Tax=Phyllobacterium myrsinacearum TaxID=28101 RepID=A0A839EU56_9HYPH|nr:SDR family NAD(P)-dependent oxidoreductase [Phyllobacterium myrsinacearum]MBA8881034.1 NAD(P)-dependent dehydrogenase (short-subunit alcohol dehydrogenase family) [Phyllobacterium myrsinacearum]
MDLKLDGKVALVTGSSKGIGEAIARGLAREKVIVVVHGRDRSQTERVARTICEQGGHAYAVVGDLTVDDEVQCLVEEAQSLAGPIDILVNNAGGSGDTEDWTNSRAASWASAYDRNVLAAVRVTTRLLPRMQAAKWGRVVNISSLAGLMPPAARPDYSACKAAMNAMTASMAKAVAADGVTVNTISPGTIHSARLDTRFREVAVERGLAQDSPWELIEQAVLPIFAQVPVGRVGTLEEIADAISFLVSPRAGYITGVNLRLDGGMLPTV